MRESMGSMRDSSRSIDGAHTDAMGDDRATGARGSHGGGDSVEVCDSTINPPRESGPTSEWERVGQVSGGRARRPGARLIDDAIDRVDRSRGRSRSAHWVVIDATCM